MFLARVWCESTGIDEAKLVKKSTRRTLSTLLVLFGAILIFLATEAWPGVLLVVTGISVELIAVILKFWKN
jgi:hypothetical protein